MKRSSLVAILLSAALLAVAPGLVEWAVRRAGGAVAALCAACATCTTASPFGRLVSAMRLGCRAG